MRVQDLFKAPDGSGIFNHKIAMHIASLPSTQTQRVTENGKTVTFYDVKMELGGDIYDWELSQAQMTRIFTKTSKGQSEVNWQAQEGEAVNVWYATPKGSGHPYYLAEPIPATGSVVGGTPPAPAVTPSVVAQKPKFAPTSAPRRAGDTPVWDGTPRQGNFRAGTAGVFQAIISNPNVNPLEEDVLRAALVLAAKYAVELRKVAAQTEAATAD